MTLVRKLVAIIAGIALFVMPAAAMPLHCILMASARQAGHSTCHMMMGDNPSSGPVAAAPSNHSCCQVSGAKPESITVQHSPASKEMIPTFAKTALLPDPPAIGRRNFFDRTSQLPSGSPQAVLCTFLV